MIRELIYPRLVSGCEQPYGLQYSLNLTFAPKFVVHGVVSYTFTFTLPEPSQHSCVVGVIVFILSSRKPSIRVGLACPGTFHAEELGLKPGASDSSRGLSCPHHSCPGAPLPPQPAPGGPSINLHAQFPGYEHFAFSNEIALKISAMYFVVVF